MIINISQLPRITNNAYYELYKNKSRYLVMVGGGGSGKSVFAVQKILFRILKQHNHRILVLRKVARTLRYSVFSLFIDNLQRWGLYNPSIVKINKSDLSMNFHMHNSEIIFAGLDDVEKIKSIAGITSIWIEEATEISKEDFNQIDLRLRGHTPTYKQIILTFNPISNLHWLKARFFDAVDPDCTSLKTTWRDNRFLDKEYIKVLENLINIDQTYYQIYNLGEWGLLTNIVFNNFVVEDFEYKEHDYDSIYNGLDFGYNNPSAYIRAGFKDNELYIFDEIYERGLTNAQMIELIKKVHPAKQIITADSARPDLIKECIMSGLKVLESKKGKDSVKDGIDFIKRFKVHIHKRCVNTANEFQLYKWREDKNGNKLDDPVDENNHALDALRYALEGKRHHFKFTVIGPDGVPQPKKQWEVMGAI
jgi:phage terminase large subunit